MNSESWIRRDYQVGVGIPALANMESLPNVIQIHTIQGEDLLVIPLKDAHPITLSYNPRKARRVHPLSDFARTEACERAIKVWKKEHPEDEDAVLVAFDPVLLKETPIENTLGAT